MGNVQVKYKAMRGSANPGDVIEDPEAWCRMILIEDRDHWVELFNNLPEDQRQALDNCFEDGDAQVFRNVGSANAWLSECDASDFAAAKEKAEKVLAGM